MSNTVASAALFDSGNAYHVDQMLAGVSADERRQYAGLHRPRQARQYLGSRWLLRQHLAIELDMAPTDVPVVYLRDRAPTLIGFTHRIGLSHSHTACLCIVAAGVPTGCDLERLRPRTRDKGAIASQYFHPREAAALAAADSGRRLADFYRLWTLKEAGRKALGQGIAQGLQTPSFSLAPVFECNEPPDPGPWTFASCELVGAGERYALALAIRAPVDTIVLHCYEPGTPRRTLDLNWSVAYPA